MHIMPYAPNGTIIEIGPEFQIRMNNYNLQLHVNQ
jgi:hypothetical protein